jgi:hypothetical protein
MTSAAGSHLEVDTARAPGDVARPSRRRRLVVPAVVTLAVLAAAVAGSFLWTDHIISTATAGLENRPPPPTANPGTSAGAAAANQASLANLVHGAVWSVNTYDGNGNPSAGSAFAVVSTSTQTLLLTSYAVIAANTYAAPPPLLVNQGGGPDQAVTVRTWDPAHDLALLVMDKGNQPVLHGTSGVAPVLGQRVYEVSGAGGPTGAITAGKLVAVSDGTLDEDIPQDSAARGGPVIDSGGDVLGMVSSAYLPPAPATTNQPGPSTAGAAAHAGVPISDACLEVLVCPGGTFP